MKKVFKIAINLIITVILVFSAITIIRFFLFDVYYVPTESMDQTIRPGELILTDKAAFGARWFKKEDMFRLPGYQNINRDDIVVFNFPEGDTVYVDNPANNYYEMYRQVAMGKDAPAYLINQEKCFLPIQNRIAYVKRCVGMPGDTIEILNGEVYHDRIKSEFKNTFQQRYRIKGDPSKLKDILTKVGVHNSWNLKEDSTYAFYAIGTALDQLREAYQDYLIVPFYNKWKQVNIFPFNYERKNRMAYDQYGPLYVPAKGDTIQLTESNLPIYQRLICTYEKNVLEILDGDYFINNIKTNQYIVKQNYYFMAGDNRNGSIDSRSWGFVPEDHIIGRARMVLFSKDRDEKTRWGRIGTILK